MAQLDAIDVTILEVLQADGRLSNLDLAQRVHLSPSACLRRVKQLEDAGVISQYVALLNPKADGFHSSSRRCVTNPPRGAGDRVEVDRRLLREEGQRAGHLDETPRTGASHAGEVLQERHVVRPPDEIPESWYL